jgi:AcrR family transcriptional regulator
MKILDGAVDAFARRGFADTRVEDILEAAHVSRPTFYKVYDSKEDVFRVIAEMSQVSLVQSIKNAVGTVRDPSDKLAKAVDAYVQWRAATGPIGRVVDLEMRRPGSPIAVLRRTTFAAVRAVLEDEMNRAERFAIDPLVYVGLVAALEAISNTLFRERTVGAAELSRRSRVMIRILQATLAEKGDPVAPLPRVSG